MGTIVRGITHNGKPHLDECMAAAIIRFFIGEITFERKSFVTKKELYDPSIIVFDIGQRYDLANNCYDHHQNPRLSAASTLVWKAFFDKNLPEHCALDNKLRPILKSISRDDKGFFCKERTEESEPPITKIFNYMRGGLSENDAFEMGVDFCEKIIRGIVAKIKLANQKTDAEILWENHTKLLGPSGKIVEITKPLPFIPKEELAYIAKIENIDFILIECIRTGFCVLPKKDFSIPEKSLYQKEYQKNGYVVYKNKNAAINHLMELSL